MKVIYRESEQKGQCPYLADGKVYEVEDVVDCGEDGVFYALIDDDTDDMWKGEPIPYPATLFEVIEEKRSAIA